MAKVSKRLRFEILRRDNHQCRYCGAKPPEAQLRVDHVVPEALGGKAEPENLVTACEPCNSGKSSIAPDSAIVDDVKQDALRWAIAMDEARAIRRALIEEREAYAKYFHALWIEWRTRGGKGDPLPLDSGWQATIDKFFEYDVEPDDIKHAVEAAMSAQHVTAGNTFRYFCGVVWNIIRDLQRTAGEILVANLDNEMYGER